MAHDLHIQTSTRLLNLLQLLIHTLDIDSNTHRNASRVGVLGVDAGREEVVGSQLDETAVRGTLGEHRAAGFFGDIGVDLPAKDGGVEGLDACEVGAGDFSPSDHLVVLVGRVKVKEGDTNTRFHLVGGFGHCLWFA